MYFSWKPPLLSPRSLKKVASGSLLSGLQPELKNSNELLKVGALDLLVCHESRTLYDL